MSKKKSKSAKPTKPAPAKNLVPIKIILPMPADHPPDAALVEPVALPADHSHDVLEEPGEKVRCVATLVRSWWGQDRIVLTAKDGHELHEVSESGTDVDVQFTPPSVG